LKHLRQFTTEILSRKNPQPHGSTPSLGHNWHRRLLIRNPQIKRVIARGLNRVRALTVFKPEIFTEYFELYRSIQQQYGIPLEDIYNMDEKGFSMGATQKSNVFISVAERQAFLRQDGNREWVSVIETISAAGKSLLSYIIFKGVYH
jgi:hypothetical protein